MKSAMHMVIFSAILLLVSCSSVRPQSPLGRLTPLSPGEAKLTSIQMPEYVHENLPYDVILGFSSEGELNIKRVCFKWLSGQASFSTSSSECLMGNNEGGSTGDSCLVQPEVRDTTLGSGMFCVGTSHVRVTSPGRLIVRIRPKNLDPGYSMLQAQVEYIYNEKLKETNIVGTPVKVEKNP